MNKAKSHVYDYMTAAERDTIDRMEGERYTLECAMLDLKDEVEAMEREIEDVRRAMNRLDAKCEKLEDREDRIIALALRRQAKAKAPAKHK